MLVSLRDRRESAIQLLTDSFAADLLTLDQFDECVARAHGAISIAELDALIAELPAKRRFRSLFGSLKRRGAMVVPGELQVTSVFGSMVLDLREACFTTATTEMRVRVVCGNLEIIVPPGLAVDCEGSTVFANVESRAHSAAGDRPLLRIRGPVVFGNVEVKYAG